MIVNSYNTRRESGRMRVREKDLMCIFLFALFISSVAVINVSGSPLPKVFVDPSSIIDLSKGANTYFGVNINIADVINLWSYDVRIKWDPTLLDYVIPPFSGWITNMNFTNTASTAWITSTTVTSGTATYGYDATKGNPAPGSGAPSYYHKATSTAGSIAAITFVTEQSFEYGSGLPTKSTLSYAYTVAGNSFGSSILSVILVKPDLSTQVLDTVTRTSAVAWTYRTNIIIQPGNFTQRGTYKLQFKSVSTTSAVGTANYIQVNWDDVGLRILVPAFVEGPFLKQGGSTFFANRPNQTEGWLFFTNTLKGTPHQPNEPVSGSGTLVTVTFKVEKLGSTILHLNDTVLRDEFLAYMDHTVQSGYFSNKLPGDANGDRSVNANDLYILGVAFGTTYEEPKYDVRADFNGDEIINHEDISLLAVNYGETY